MPEEIIKIDTEKGKLWVTAGVWKILKLMAEHNYISQQEIRRIWSSSKTLCAKPEGLQEVNLITSFLTGLNPKIAYCLTAKGYHFLQSHNALRVSQHFYPNDFNPSTFAHTLACVQTQLAFEKHPFIQNYLSTKVLNKGKDKLPKLQPDAEFVFRKNGTTDAEPSRGAVEVELSRKSPQRNIERMVKYSNRLEIRVVLWVCGSDYIMHDLQSVVKKADKIAGNLRDIDKFRFVLFQDILTNSLAESVVVDWTNNKRSIFEDFKTQSELTGVKL